MRFKSRQIAILILTFIVIVFITSCEYEPTEKFSRQVNKNVAIPDVQIIGTYSRDTMILNKDTSINFKFNCSTKFDGVSFLIDNIEKINQYGDGSSENIFNLLSDGTHYLNIKTYIGSGTGSISDRIGAEGYIKSWTWVLIINRNFNNGIDINIKKNILENELPLCKQTGYQKATAQG